MDIHNPQIKIDEMAFSWAKTTLGTDFEVSKEYGREDNSIHRLRWENGSAFLKVGPNLKPEAERLQWLTGKFPAPSVIGFTTIDTSDLLLMSEVPGINTCTLSTTIGAEAVTTKLAEALLQLHNIDSADCPFGKTGTGNVLTHGDACLPNFMFYEDGKLSGYIDLGECAAAPKEVDLAATVWSLQYNFGPGYGIPFLEKYGIRHPDEQLVHNLYEQYEARI